jgi:hypothetical protein
MIPDSTRSTRHRNHSLLEEIEVARERGQHDNFAPDQFDVAVGERNRDHRVAESLLHHPRMHPFRQ